MSDAGQRPRTNRAGDVIAQFVARAHQHPDRIAIFEDAEAITYDELERRSRAVAAGLQQRGLVPGDRVVVALGRSIDFVTAVLGVVRAGAVYVPVDPCWPAERRRTLDRIADPAFTVSAGAGDGAGIGDGNESSSVAELVSAGQGRSGVFDDSSAKPDDPIYVMFTSGTTGEPKGVVVAHRAVSRLVIDPDFLDTDGERTWLHLAATSFDAATLEIWMPLVRGHAIAVVPDAVPSLDRIAGVIATHGVTDAWLTASLFNAMVDFRLDAFENVRQVLTGGERISPDHAGRFLAQWPGLRLINGYGPTENTTFTCCHTIDSDDTSRPEGVPIGRPIRGTRIRIVDAGLNDVTDGTPGELLAGGEGVALGYLGDDDLTARRFVEQGGETWYRTGDLVCRDGPDEPVVYLGRRDRQVKVRGHRIELDEVERVLCEHPGVASAFAAAVGEQADERELVAAVELAHDAPGFPIETLRVWALDRAPKPIVPDRVMVLERVPVGPNGKADRDAIRSLLTAGHGDRESAPADRIADWQVPEEAWQRFASLVAETLPGAPISPDDRFVEIGGHSLAALRLAAAVQAQHRVDLPLADILGPKHLGALALTLDGLMEVERATPSTDATPRIEGDPLRATSIQRQFFFENAVDPTGVAYLEFAGFVVESGEFSPERMADAFSRLVSRHEALRTRLVLRGDALIQEIDPAGSDAMRRVTVHQDFGSTRSDDLASVLRAAVSRPFDLEHEWPVRLDLFQIERSEWAVVLAFQHIAIDEWSLRIAAEELALLYDDPDASLEPAPQYLSYSLQEAAGIARGHAEQSANRLMTIGRPTMQLGRAPAQAIDRAIAWPDRDGCHELCARLGVTPTALSCGLYAAAIASVTGLDRVAILTPVSRRLDLGLQRVVGCCNMMHALVIDTPDPASASGLDRIIISASSAIVNAYTDAPVPFDAVARILHKHGVRDHAAVPFGFAYETNPPFCPAFSSIRVRPLPIRSPIARFPLGLSIDSRDGQPIAVFTTPQAEGARERLDQFANQFQACLRRLDSGTELPRGGSSERSSEPQARVARDGASLDAPESAPRRSGSVDARRIAHDAWVMVLGVSPASDLTHFFDSGGHSLLLLRLAARIRVVADAEIPLGAFLDEPTFGKLVSLVARHVSGKTSNGEAGFHIEEFGEGERVVVCIPGAFGRPISFGRLAEEFAHRDSGVRLRCYNVYDAMSGRPVPEGFELVLSQLARDFDRPETAGMLGFCAGGLYPLFLGALAESRMRRLRLWMLNVFATESPDEWLSLRVQSLRDAALDPAGMPAAVRDSLVTLWRMAMVRLRGSEEGVSADQFTHAEFQKVLARRGLGIWRGGSTVLIAGRKPVWRTYYRNSRLNGLAEKLQGPTRTVVLPLMHHEVLTSGAAVIAAEIHRDIEAAGREGTA